MTEPSAANFELTIALPLGVVANQLARIEADLRFLSMKAPAYAVAGDNGEAKISGSLEKISEALDLIRGLVADMEAALERAPARPSDKSSRDRTFRKSTPDRDD
jgi:hypothetical protein